MKTFKITPIIWRLIRSFSLDMRTLEFFSLAMSGAWTHFFQKKIIILYLSHLTLFTSPGCKNMPKRNTQLEDKVSGINKNKRQEPRINIYLEKSDLHHGSDSSIKITPQCNPLDSQLPGQQPLPKAKRRKVYSVY